MTSAREAESERRLAGGNDRDFVEAFARGIDVIGAFGKERRQLSLSDVARVTALPRASVRRMLHTLVCLNLAETDGRVFRLTPRILGLSADYLGSNKVSTVVQPVCERIAAKTNRACFVAVLNDHDIVVVAHALSQHPMELAPAIGLRLPAFCTAAGRAILSTMDDTALDHWLAGLKPKPLTKFTPTSKTAIRKAIVDARTRGYGSTNQEAHLGDRAFAVPLKRYDGTTVAALNVTNPADDPRADRYLPLLQAEAAQLQKQLF
jgi:IclR family pca regulon transcriptional regulator